jgi:hypothetical protein
MADYYPLIAKAVAGLDKSTGEARRALYERARTALVTQLRGVVPALSESDITRERLALEEAIRKVEAEAARKSRFDPPPERRRGEAPDPFKPPVPPQREGAPAENRRGDTGAPPDDAEPTLSGTAADLRRPAKVPPAERNTSLSNDGLKGFRDVVAEAENLGDATAHAGRTARQAYAAVPSPSPEFDRLEPRLDPDGLRSSRDRRPTGRDQRRDAPQTPQTRDPQRDSPRDPARQPPQMREPPPAAREPASREPISRDPPRRDSISRDMPRDPQARERSMPRDRSPGGPRPQAPRSSAREPDADFDVSPRGEQRGNEFSARDFDPVPDFDFGAGAAESERGTEASRKAKRRRVEMTPAEDEQPRSLLRSGRKLVTSAAIILAVLLVAGAVAWEWRPIVETLSALVTPSKVAPPSTQQTAAPSTRPKSNDRVPSNDSARQGSQAAADVAQRVVLYEEDPNDQAGKQYVGSAVWRTELVSPGAGLPPEMVVRADIELPERKMTMKWSLKRNADKTLPASHTVEVVFKLPQDFPHGGVQNIPGVLMKEAEQTRGVPLAGLAVKVMDGYFLIGLSAVDSEMQRNIALLKSRPWFDVPVVYTDGRRAILAVEKGTPGDRAFTDAFTAWKQ